MVLRLEVQDFADLTRWRWVLTDDSSGDSIADHVVRLDATCWQFEAFVDLPRYLSWHAAADRRSEDEARIVGDLGSWIGSEVFGPIAGVLVKRQPVTVRIVVPMEAEALAFRPLELAHVGERPIALQNVTLVMQPTSNDWGPENDRDPVHNAVPDGERLRMLGLFSLPEGRKPLNLRRERYSLVKLIRGITGRGKAADVHVLQYGVTRSSLREVLAEGEGWDIIHISGHGAPGELLLETVEGKPDPVSAIDLADLLESARGRLKLVTIAACWSAAVNAAEQRKLLGLPVSDVPGTRGDSGSVAGTLATELAKRLRCAVLAMRYPVGDEFAIALAEQLYELLADQGQQLPSAVGTTLQQLAGGTSRVSFRALSAATPVLFGGNAVNLRLAAPDCIPSETYAMTASKMAGFPPQADRFVGRTGVMARASAALASKSGVPGMLLHGMPGGGKSACAMELAYGHEHAFDQLVWFKAPDEGATITGALIDFALTLERYLPDFQMSDALAEEKKLTRFLPQLTEIMEQRRVLIVVDNVESLLTESGQWRDERWGGVIGAMSAHAGEGRLILTSRRVPLDLTGLQVEAVDALSADESLLLAWELPHLRALINGELPGIERHLARRLARRALSVALGHPKLLELANGQAAHPEELAKLVELGGQVWQHQGGLPDGFFSSGGTTAAATDYLEVMAAWTSAIVTTLSPGEQALFWFLCCLEEPDRRQAVLDSIWPRLWRRVRSIRGGSWISLWGRLGRSHQPIELNHALSALVSRGLTAIRGGNSTEGESYAIHPGVAAAGRVQSGRAFQDAVDSEAAAFWQAAYRKAGGATGDEGADIRQVIHAGLAAVPYLMRQQQWWQAGSLLDEAFLRDPSRPNATILLPAIQEISSHDSDLAGVLARVWEPIDITVAEAKVRIFLDDRMARKDYWQASVAAERLMILCRSSGRLTEALTLADRVITYSRNAGMGPWTQLNDEVSRLEVLDMMGQANQVLAELPSLRARMDALSTASKDEATAPWNVREGLLSLASNAARQLGRWEEALELNAENIASKRTHNASATRLAMARFNDYRPLLGLGRIGQALNVVLECQEVFRDARDPKLLGRVLTALAAIEVRRGHVEPAALLERDALRYRYLAGDVAGIAISYHNLGDYLNQHAGQLSTAFASHLVAALIRILIGGADADDSVSAAAADLEKSGADSVSPTHVSDLCERIGDIPGTDAARLISTITPDPATAERALLRLVHQVQALARDPHSDGRTR